MLIDHFDDQGEESDLDLIREFNMVQTIYG